MEFCWLSVRVIMLRTSKIVLQFLVFYFAIYGCAYKGTDISNCRVFHITSHDNLKFQLEKIASTYKSNVVVELDKGEYYIDRQIVLEGVDNFNIFGNNSVVKMRNDTPVENYYGMISFKQSANVTLNKITFDGNRHNRFCKETAAHTLMIISSNNFVLNEIACIDNAVDGIIIYSFNPLDSNYHCKNIFINNCKIHNSFRNGISIIEGNGIIISNTEVSGSKGVSPESGVVIESDIDLLPSGIRDIKLNDVTINNNNGWGIIISQKGQPSNTIINKCKISNSGLGGIWNCSSTTSIQSSVFSYNGDVGIRSVRYEKRYKDFTLIQGNIIKHEKCGIEYLGFGGVIDSNRIDSIEDRAIYLNGWTIDSTTAILQKNTISNSNKVLIEVNGFTNGFFESNTLEYSKNIGLRVVNSSINLHNNTFKYMNLAIDAEYTRLGLKSNLFEKCGNKVSASNSVKFLYQN